MGILLGIVVWLLLVALAGKGSFVASVALFGLWLYGTYRASRAHWLLGIVALLVPPVTVALCIISIFAQRDFGRDIVAALSRSRR